MPNTPELSSRLKTISSKNKYICFGRYAIKVPSEAEIVWGNTDFPSTVEFFDGGVDAAKDKIRKDIDSISKAHKTAEITFNGVGPIENSWQIRYYEDDIEKELGIHFFKTYINKGSINFSIIGTNGKEKSEALTVAREHFRAKSIRLRDENEIPTTPGYCIEHGFLANDQYDDQEIIDAGIYLPSFPDVSFSISSNKNAYGDYTDFEEVMRAELSLLARIKQAQDDQGLLYPSRTVLREGKRAVQHWLGEESLIRRKDGTHDFEWHFVGTPRDVANPPEFNVKMYTKVKHNTVGAAEAASLSDDEAIALWDTLLSELKFRVKVPGAPEGSYLFSPGGEGLVAAGPNQQSTTYKDKQ